MHTRRERRREGLGSGTGRAAGLRWAREQEAAGAVDIVHLTPRYNPWWSRWLLRVPVVRELLTWNLVLVLRRR